MGATPIWAPVIAAVVALTVLGGPVAAQTAPAEDIDRLEQQLEQLWRADKYEDAVPVAERYIAATRKRHGDTGTEYATALAWLASLYQELDRYADAEPLLKQSLAIREKVLGPDDPAVARSLNSLARLYKSQSRYDEAEPLYRRSLAIYEKANGPDDAALAPVLSNLALMLMALDRSAEAEPLLTRALAIAEKAPASENVDVTQYLASLAGLRESQGRYRDAETLFRRALSESEKALGKDHPSQVNIISSLGALYQTLGRARDAEPLLRRSVSIVEKARGPDHPEVAYALANLGEFLVAEERCQEAEEGAMRVLRIREKVYGKEHPAMATALHNLAVVYKCEGRFAEADELLEDSLEINERILGPTHTDVAATLMFMASSKNEQGAYAESQALAERARDIYRQAYGPEHPSVAGALDVLAQAYESQGRIDEAEAMLKQSLAIAQTYFGERHRRVATNYSNLGWMYRRQGRFADAERSLKTALAIGEETLGPDHPEVARMTSNLAIVLDDEARYQDAEPLLRRALAVAEAAFGAEHRSVATKLNNLGENLRKQGREADALPVLTRALAITEKVFGPRHPDVATALNNLGLVHARLRHDKEAEEAFRRALAINEAVFGVESSEAARDLGNLGGLFIWQGQYEKAEPLMQRALAITRKTVGPEHPDLAQALSQVADVSFRQGKWRQAIEPMREAIAIMTKREIRNRGVPGQGLTGKAVSEPFSKRPWLIGQLKALYRLREGEPGEAASLLAESFTVAQWAQRSEAAGALAQMAARAAAGDESLARLVRERQDLVAEWQDADKRLAAERAKPAAKRDTATDRQLLERLAVLDADVKAKDERLGRDFPEYAALAAGDPVSITDVQGRLADSEALVLIVEASDLEPTPKESFVWVITRTDAKWVRSSLSAEALQVGAATLRCGLDRQGEWQWSKDKGRWLAKKPLCAALAAGGLAKGDLLPFDLAMAYRLYRDLFAAVEDAVAGKQLLVVTSPALASLPLNVLVTSLSSDPPSGEQTRQVAFLGAEMEDIAPDRRREAGLEGALGANIKQIYSGSAAEAAGLKASDVLLSVNGKDVAGYQNAIEVIRSQAPNARVPVRIWRQGKVQEVPVTLGETPLRTWIPRLLTAENGRDVAWLARRHAVTVLPSVVSLVQLRRDANRTAASAPFLGFGNPLLTGKSGSDRRAWDHQSCRDPAADTATDEVAQSWLPDALASLFRAGAADVTVLKRQPPLPETADELCAVARALGAGPDSVNLGQQATETRVKALNADGSLARAGVVHFATHGLLASETESLAGSRAEPALLLTPPDEPSAADDGLLTASEVAGLTLHADWAVLSACNTAAGGDKGAAETLSGLARAFFYAGARALLVSHWYVDSRAAVAITTGAFAELKRDPAIGRAEALRRSMIAAMQGSDPAGAPGRSAHPATWAPFVIVGEGGAGR